MPVPWPVTAAGSRPVNAQMSAADAVVLAMPMSPVSRHRLPAATRSRAISTPTMIAAWACSRVSAGPAVKSAVPWAILRGSSPGTGPRSAQTPTSTTTTSAPACAANALATAPPARKLATICAVTSCGHGVTRWACTPWSAAKMATAAGSGIGGGQHPGQPGEPDRHLLQHAERAARLGHQVLARAGRAHRRLVQRADHRPVPHRAGPSHPPPASRAGHTPPCARPRTAAACRAQPASASSGSRRESRHVADAQVGDHLQVRREAKLGGEFTLA